MGWQKIEISRKEGKYEFNFMECKWNKGMHKKRI